MNPDYSVQFLKLVGKSFAWIAGLAFALGTLGLLCFAPATWYVLVVGLVGAGYALVYSAIPVFLFAGFVVTLRAFGRNKP